MGAITSSQFDYVPQKEEESHINYNFEERGKEYIMLRVVLGGWDHR